MAMPPDTTKWTPEQDAELERRWLAGESTAAIGRAMGLTKNSIIGRSRRIGLPRRASPLHQGRISMVAWQEQREFIAELAAQKLTWRAIAELVSQRMVENVTAGQVADAARAMGIINQFRNVKPVVVSFPSGEPVQPVQETPRPQPFRMTQKFCATCQEVVGPRFSAEPYCGLPVDRGAYCKTHADKNYKGIPGKPRSDAPPMRAFPDQARAFG